MPLRNATGFWCPVTHHAPRITLDFVPPKPHQGGSTASPMSFLSLIESKRDGRELSPEAIAGFVRDFTEGRIPDYQMAAMLMAIHFRGMSAAETRALTLAMRDSGDVLAFPEDPRPIVDKHSTGGV